HVVRAFTVLSLLVCAPALADSSACSAQWNQAGGSAPAARERAAVVYDPDRALVILFGGLSVSGSPATFFPDVWSYAAGAWAPMNPPAPSGAPSARADGRFA